MRYNPGLIKKAQRIYFSRKFSKKICKFTFDGSNVETCSSQKHVGLIMDDKLSFDVHVQTKVSKCYQIIEILRRLPIILSRDALLTLYKMFIRLHLDYQTLYMTNLKMNYFVKRLKAFKIKHDLSLQD